MKVWAVAPQIPLALDEDLGIPPLLSTLLAQRGFTDPDEIRAWLNPQFYSPASHTALPHLSTVYTRFQQALEQDEKILIFADADLDGITSGLMLKHFLGEHSELILVDFYFSSQRIQRYLANVQLVIICDLVLDSPLPVDTLIFDHHITSQNHAFLVNPTLLPPQHALYHLSTAGIVFLFLQHAYQDSRQLANLQDLLLLGLLADRAPLVKDVRYWVQTSLSRLRKTKRLGLLALFDLLGLDVAHLTYDDLAFQVIPALSAFVKLADPKDLAKLLTTTRRDELTILANQALALNDQRKLMTRQIAQTIHEQLENDRTLLSWSILIFENPNWDRALLGQVASRLSQTYQRPVILLKSDAAGIAKGSARTITETDLLAALARCEDLLIRFGGHAQAAALEIPREQIPALQRRLSNLISSSAPTLTIAAEIPLSQANLELAQMVERLAPFGNGNLRPVFVTRNLKKVRSAKLGRADEHRRLTVRDDDGLQVSVFWWNSRYFPQPEGLIHLAYEIQPIFEETGYSAQLNLVDWQVSEEAETSRLSNLAWIDCRARLDLEHLRQTESDLVIWAEGMSKAENVGVGFSELSHCTALLIYTAPASPQLLQKALQKTQAERLYVHFAPPPYDQSQKLLEAVSALLRAALAQFKGKIKLSQLAERTAHAPETIRLALRALENQIQIEWENSQNLIVHAASPPPLIDDPALDRAISETAAYRRYLQNMRELENLLT